MLKHHTPLLRVLCAMVAVVTGFAAQACQMESNTNEPSDAAELAAEQVRIGGMMWYVDYEAAVGIARKQDKSLWVHFGENPG